MKVLIVTYIYPPCTLTPGNRIYSWAKYLHQFGISPIIVTRHWDDDVKSENYTLKSVPTKLSIEKTNEYEVHRVPYFGNYRTKNITKKKNLFQKIIYNINAVKEALLRYYFPHVLPYGNLFDYTNEYLSKNKVDVILITGNPFQLFKLGYDMKRKYHLPWIADYRDGWTTEAYKENKGILTNLVFKLDKYFEKKWVGSASAFTTVSDALKESIANYVNIKGHVVYNGFFKEELSNAGRVQNDSIVFLYSGAIYPKQDYQTFVSAFKKIYPRYKSKIEIKLIFLGTTFLNPSFANDPIFMDTKEFIFLADRVSYQESLNIHESCDVFLMFSHKGMKGQASSKIFDYMKYEKPILLYDNDKDVLENLLIKSNLGIICNTKKEIEENLIAIIEQKINTGKINSQPNVDYINTFSREEQAGKLAEIIKKQ